MARNDRDTQFLEQHGGKWRVTIPVPRHLQHRLPTKLKKSLNTDSLSQANRVKWAVINVLRARIEAVANEKAAETSDAMETARRLRNSRHDYPSSENLAAVAEIIEEWEDKLRGKPLSTVIELDPETDEHHYRSLFDPERDAVARKFREIAMMPGIPVDRHHGEYMKTLSVTYRTRADDARALTYLRDWCERENVNFTLQALLKRHAIKFCREMGPDNPQRAEGLQIEDGTNLDPVTRKKYLTRLSAYWSYLQVNELVKTNIWVDCKISIPKKPGHVKERHFTNDEVRRLLLGPAKQAMRDLMMMGALTGARIEAIVSLKVGETADGVFTFKAMKSEDDDRDLPIHPDLKEIVSRRSNGKKDTDDFFPEWPPVRRIGSMRERSYKASTQFIDYRRSCGVEDRYVRIKIAPDGSRHYDSEPVMDGDDKSTLLKLRRSRVNFHSFRRWFITRLEQAGTPGPLISAMVGHERDGTTLKIYSGGPEFEQARHALASLTLPPLTDEPVPEPRALRRSR